MARFLGIDVGGSATRWHLQDDGKPARTGRAGGFSGHLFRPEIRERAEHTIADLAQAIGQVDGVVVGVTGLTPPSPETETLAAMFGSALKAPAVRIMTDSRLAFLTAFPAGRGILVYAGTGSVGAHVMENGELLLVGGKGVLIDDAGGGYWIAIRSLRAILRAEDRQPGSGWGTALGKAMADRVGGTDWGFVRQAVYGAERGAIGVLALATGEAAAVGDSVALDILGQAGSELAELALMLEARIGAQPIALAGRAASLSSAVLDGMRAALPGRDVTGIELDCAEGAARLAASQSLFTGLQYE